MPHGDARLATSAHQTTAATNCLGVAVDDPLELLDLRRQCRDLLDPRTHLPGQRLQLLDQLCDERPRGQTASKRNRFRFISSHRCKVPFTAKDSCSQRRHPVNAY